jgi:hypothetical protein
VAVMGSMLQSQNLWGYTHVAYLLVGWCSC